MRPRRDSNPRLRNFARDLLRESTEVGVHVLRFPDDEMLKCPDAVAETIYNCLVERMPSPRPSPGVPGEGVER